VKRTAEFFGLVDASLSVSFGLRRLVVGRLAHTAWLSLLALGLSRTTLVGLLCWAPVVRPASGAAAVGGSGWEDASVAA
jgi:hypothetical protein